MKIKTLLILIFFIIISCKTQQLQNTALPKIENYSKGKLDLIVTPFGLDSNEIKIGNISADGIIHFNWPTLDLNTIESSVYFMEFIVRAAGMNFCNDKQEYLTNETTKAVDTKNIFLYKNGQQVGSLYPATQKGMEDNGSLNRYTNLILGSEISWFYSDSDVTFKATCTINNKYEGYYDFKEVTTYHIKFNKGWNLVQHTLEEKEDWKNGEEQGSLPKTMTKTSISYIPTNIKWFMKYWGN